ncbi:hypothetical protein SDRG_04930 [Saprolegnia diclina VS20]|uniref:ATP-grasp domain-containing protein n=1 Tax=Saprolegnia diclina (strain VS20) TaxID=1156394 RepID=T0S526_SAPDV|nr:hypothetical protein SDRG_04930 [Saprolegnia diclina VS20]EQC37912.1 hypothetical protein SDRG_04930 [Saprolegnia diclina VS20]|eukprot:XP_008608845.1 hypothetical protein SDRG_04930 [Saprolegnia diclina VS20]
MGNSNSAAASPTVAATESSASPAPSPRAPSSFRLLSADQRAVTFDERIHLPRKSIPLPHHPHPHADFKKLSRAATFDPRMRQTQDAVRDVLHKRYFNAKEERDAQSLGLSAIPELDSGSHAIVVVDPFSTGMVLAEEVMKREYTCIALYSDTLVVMKPLIQHIRADVRQQFTTEIYHNGADKSDAALEATIAALKKVGVPILGVLPGAETGVCLADRLSDRMGLASNGAKGTEARRNKYLMGEKIRAAKLRAVKQCSATTWNEIVAFLENDLRPDPFEVIVKPVESAGSDDVTLCRSMDEVRAAFGNIQGKINHLGLANTATLVQEYLVGTEYVVDTVSRDGVHKVVAVWEYDKRPVNGAPFVYYGVLLRDASSDVAQRLIAYILQVLDALEIRIGPGHAEVKFVHGEPCLVEIGARCHGGEGTYIPIVTPCIGYNQVGVTLDAYFDKPAFDALPVVPATLRAHGCEAMLVAYEHGTLTALPGLDEITRLGSYVSSSFHAKVGDRVVPTRDMFDTPGSILLVHASKDILEADYARIRALEHDGLYAIEPSCPVLDPLEVVVVVDPFSTGAVVAERVTRRGYACICLYSDRLDKMEGVASLVPDGLTLQFAATAEHTGDASSTSVLLQRVADAIEHRRANIIAVLPGAETGVLLADELGTLLNLTRNKMEHTLARRDKYLMGETLRDAGVRAVQQAKCTTWAQVKAFIDRLAMETFEVVLKPVNSAGTEDVTLCLSLDEAKDTFHTILGKINGLGLTNEAVLVQEFLEGDEYVIDTVSCNGKHKVTAIWKYDKRRVNDAAFVYFGLSIVPATPGLVDALIDYQFTVLDALGFEHGPGHGEVKFCRGSPVLIEVGARCHGGEGAWVPIADTCVGYNQVDVTVDVYLGRHSVFDALPERPLALPQYGCEVMLVSYVEGVLQGYPGLKEITAMPSFLRKDLLLKPGDRLKPTIDMFTTPGSILLIHADATVLDADRRRIRELEVAGLYDVA